MANSQPDSTLTSVRGGDFRFRTERTLSHRTCSLPPRLVNLMSCPLHSQTCYLLWLKQRVVYHIFPDTLSCEHPTANTAMQPSPYRVTCVPLGSTPRSGSAGCHGAFAFSILRELHTFMSALVHSVPSSLFHRHARIYTPYIY